MPDTPDSARSNDLSVALIVPDAARRQAIKTAISESRSVIAREFDAYPSLDERAEIARRNFDIVIVDLSGDAAPGLSVIEAISRRNASMTVMACSSQGSSDLLRRSMQAGAREFLTDPLLPEAVAQAFIRASARRPNRVKELGKTLVFLSTKAGVGSTTIGLNFSLALKKESDASVVLVDLDFQLGEVAAGLGMTPVFSVMDALLNPVRLDKEFLSTLLLRHNSGLAVLAAPEEYGFFHSPLDGATGLFQILQEEFDYVVVDAGCAQGAILHTIFDVADTLYLVTERTFPALRNAHRIISFLSAKGYSRRLEVILNRFDSRRGDIDEDSAEKAMGRSINWRIPNSFTAARTAQDNGVPLALEDSPVTRALGQMAKAVCGKPLTVEKKKERFSFFGAKAAPLPAED